jgi:hypothetical protein
MRHAIAFINPGTGPVYDATAEYAEANMDQLLADCNLPAPGRWERTPDKDCGGGRYAFSIHCADRSCEVEMPGRPLDEVRYTKAPGQNIWHYPRLYVDGDSGVWKFAVDDIRFSLTSTDDET